MTVRAPSEECLTQTQIAQRELLAQIREKQDPAKINLLKPVEASKKNSQSYGSPFSRYLDITV